MAVLWPACITAGQDDEAEDVADPGPQISGADNGMYIQKGYGTLNLQSSNWHLPQEAFQWSGLSRLL